MSRQPINEEICNIGSQLRKGMDSLTIVDPGRLRVPFGGGNKTPRKQSWMTVTNTGSSAMEPSIEDSSVKSSTSDVVIDISSLNSRQPCMKLSLETVIQPILGPIMPGRQMLEHHWEIKGWVLSLGYSVFGLGLALCNLLTSASTSRVCVVMSPIPMACLLLQTLFCMDYGIRQGNYARLEIWCLIISALLLPTACVLWNLYISIPLTLFLSLSIFSCVRQRNILVWVCISGVCLSLIVALPTPTIQLFEPKWGMTVALFFLGILCFLAGMSQGGIEFKIKCN